MTQCFPSLFTFQNLGARDVVAAFDWGKVTSDAGGPRPRGGWPSRTCRPNSGLLQGCARLPLRQYGCLAQGAQERGHMPIGRGVLSLGRHRRR
jgi:hypothetical protein